MTRDSITMTRICRFPACRSSLLCLFFCACSLAIVLPASSKQAQQTAKGRYLHFQIPGKGKILSLAEVQVIANAENIAVKGKTRQTSIAHGGVSGRAIDGKTDGEWKHGSVTHTAQQNDPAWELDLGAVKEIEQVVVWNRSQITDRLNGCRVSILDNDRNVVCTVVLENPGAGPIELNPAEISPPEDAKKKIKVLKTVAVKSRSRPKKKKSTAPPLPETNAPGTPETLRLAITDMITTFGEDYPKGREFLRELDEIEKLLHDGGEDTGEERFELLKQKAMLSNPLIDFDTFLLIERQGHSGLPNNWQGNSSIGKRSYKNRIATLSPLHDGELKTVYQPELPVFVGDVDLHFDRDRMLFCSPDSRGAWQIYEIGVDGSGLRQVTKGMGDDIDNYDPCYLPDGRIMFVSSTGYQGVPCVGGKHYVGNLHLMNADGSSIRRVTFEQDNDWCPTMLLNGRVLYLRWEYTDSAHYFSRLLMHMNPDGTDQKEYYGSNSYWPNGIFYARPVPGSSTEFVGIVSGHHGVARSGELVLFDTELSRYQAEGVKQRIPGHGLKVEGGIYDRLVVNSLPKFLHPYPLSNKYFITSAAPDGKNWGVYLVDVFDNMLLLKNTQGKSLFEPVPLKKTPKPRIIPDTIRPDEKEATFFIVDIYEGEGLRGVPRGSVKQLRIFNYEYALRNSGGHTKIGIEGPWDIHVILGTVPVEEDGSVLFKAPANTPISLQPLDENGMALQIMRSWTVGMPGEFVSCIGCHAHQSAAPITKNTIASRREPSRIEQWRGPPRGFSFTREIQPLLDRYCVGCHNGGERKDAKQLPCFLADHESKHPGSYLALHPYVRRNGPEGDYHILTPLEFHAETSELVQMLQKGHHNVNLDEEAWDRLITWIDLNVPAVGTWTEEGAKPEYIKRRKELRKLYAGIATDPEAIVNPYTPGKTAFIRPKAGTKKHGAENLEGWPFNSDKALEKQSAAGAERELALELDNDHRIQLVRVPAGSFLMGSTDETSAEAPLSSVTIDRPFWMGTTEITLEQYQQFDPDHRNGVYDMHWKDQVDRGYYMNEATFPVIRVTWSRAREFCNWLSEKTGRIIDLPTEAEWEWACRAGTNTPLSFGNCESDFAKHANLADITMKELAVRGVNPQPMRNPPPLWDYVPKDARFDDGVLHLADVASYQPNPWGLYDMHGNAAEWTASAMKPYPYRKSDGRNSRTEEAPRRVIRGGSWHDRQHRATSSYRLGFPEWQKVYNVGFRIVVRGETDTLAMDR